MARPARPTSGSDERVFWINIDCIAPRIIFRFTIQATLNQLRHQYSSRFSRSTSLTMKAATILSLLPLAFAAPASKRVGGPAPILKPRDAGDNLIEGQYIVKLKDGMTIASVDDTLSLFEGEAEHEWKTGAFKGFAAKLDEAALDALTNHPDVRILKRLDTISLLTSKKGRVH